MSSFWCRDPANHIVTLPLSVQARLRNIARQALKLLEHKVLKSLDDCLSQSTQPQPREKMAIWACLWQLILMYRDLLAAFRSQAARANENGTASPVLTTRAIKGLINAEPSRGIPCAL